MQDLPKTHRKLNPRSKTQIPSIESTLRDSVSQIVQETQEAKEELAKMRADLHAESTSKIEQYSKSIVKDSEVATLVRELQVELTELHQKIDSAHSQIRDKEVENYLLRQNISNMMVLGNKEKCPECLCLSF